MLGNADDYQYGFVYQAILSFCSFINHEVAFSLALSPLHSHIFLSFPLQCAARFSFDRPTKQFSNSRTLIFNVLTASVNRLPGPLKALSASSLRLDSCADVAEEVLTSWIRDVKCIPYQNSVVYDDITCPELCTSYQIDTELVKLARETDLSVEEMLVCKTEVLLESFQRQCLQEVAESVVANYLENNFRLEHLLDEALDAFESPSPLSINSESDILYQNTSTIVKPFPTCIAPTSSDIEEVVNKVITFSSSSALAMKRMSVKHRVGKLFESSINPVHWEDIGGMQRVRQEVLDIFHLPLRYPTLFGRHVPRRRSILLYGPPGTGKTMVARAIATECGMNFVSVKGPELLDSYVGESEKNVRDVFAYAHSTAPCVIFFDELDSLAPARGRGKSGGGLMDRIVSQILTEMDELVTGTSYNDEQHVFVIGATNRPDLLEPALLRPGRFDRKIYISISEDKESKFSILKAQTRNFNVADDVDLEVIASELPPRMSGADIGAVCRTAYSSALDRVLFGLSTSALGNNEGQEMLDYDDENICSAISNFLINVPSNELVVVIQQSDFIFAASIAKSSITQEELDAYVSLGSTFDDNTNMHEEPLPPSCPITLDNDHSYKKSIEQQQIYI